MIKKIRSPGKKTPKTLFLSIYKKQKKNQKTKMYIELEITEDN